MIRRPLSSLKLKQTDIEEMDANMSRVQKPKESTTTSGTISEVLKEGQTERQDEPQKMDTSEDS
uniref:Candidate secreted effector n=1 Tax=Meloidogyne incognita TaxID=6306 RepID=A0A914MQ82_MELIC